MHNFVGLTDERGKTGAFCRCAGEILHGGPEKCGNGCAAPRGMKNLQADTAKNCTKGASRCATFPLFCEMIETSHKRGIFYEDHGK